MEQSGIGMFSEEALAEAQAQEEEWRRSTQGSEKIGPEAATYSGIKLKPVYSPNDIADTSCDDIPFPGQYPYTRGFNPLGYRAEPWMIQQFFGFGTGADTRKRWDYYRSIGATDRIGRDEVEGLLNFRIAIDLPTQRGYDPDEPQARGRVGGCGVSLSTLEDMKLLFDGVPLDKAHVALVSLNSSIVAGALFIAYAESRGYPPEKLLLRGNNILYQVASHDVISFPPKYTLRLMTELIHYFVRHVPRSPAHTTITGYNLGEQGPTGIQVVALNLAVAIAVTEECVKVGLDPDDVVPGFYTHEWVGIDLFEEVAKIRARRRLWARNFKERFGCKKPESLRCRVMPQTAGSMGVAQEPLNNIVRYTVMTLAAILAGADGIFTTAYDEPLCVPAEEAVRIALRTQQILYHETSLPHVVDPLGGSYYLEWLTNELEEGVDKYLAEIESQGGFFKCWETGWIRAQVEKVANERQRRIDCGEIVIVGQNKYRLPDEQQPKVAVFPSFDPGAEEEAIARVRRYREQRDQEKTNAALARVQQAAEAVAQDWPQSCGLLMPAVVDACRAQSTLGEIHGILRHVFGYVYTGV